MTKQKEAKQKEAERKEAERREFEDIAQKHLDAMKEQGYSVDRAQEMLNAYKDVQRSDYDNEEDYLADLDDAWCNYTIELQAMDFEGVKHGRKAGRR